MSVNADGVRGIERVGESASVNMGVGSANFGVSKPLNGDAAYRGSIWGSVVAHQAGVNFSKGGNAESGFAIVDLGAPGVEIFNGYGSKSTTGSDGVALVRLQSLQKSRLTIDVNTAPDGLDLSPIELNVQRCGGLLLKRTPEVFNGRFIQIAGAVAGDVVQVGSDSLPVTDRGVWVELAKGSHVVKLNGVNVDVAID